jgi:hypothetical protein
MQKHLWRTLAFLVIALPAFPKTWYLQTTGSDSNACTYVPLAPCQSFVAAAITSGIKDGDVVAALDSVDLGDGGTVSVLNSVTIDGGSHGAFLNASTVSASGNGLIIQNSNKTYIFKNLNISLPVGGGTLGSPNSGPGIGVPSFVTALTNVKIIVQNVTISSADPNCIGISFPVDSASTILLENVKITGCHIGISIQLASGSTAPFNLVMRNVSVNGSGSTGAVITDGNGTISNSHFANTTTGLSLQKSLATTSPTWTIENTELINNGTGAVVGTGATMRISNSVVSGNTTGLEISGTGISFRNNTFSGNGADGAPALSTSTK